MHTPLLGSEATTKTSIAVKRSRSQAAGLASENGASSSSGSSVDALAGGGSGQQRGTMGSGRGYRPLSDTSAMWQRWEHDAGQVSGFCKQRQPG